MATQRKACDHYALKYGYKVLSYFGGTYESTENDERKEFQSMLNFVKKSKEPISYMKLS